jgi:hypothetical protein
MIKPDNSTTIKDNNIQNNSFIKQEFSFFKPDNSIKNKDNINGLKVFDELNNLGFFTPYEIKSIVLKCNSLEIKNQGLNIMLQCRMKDGPMKTLIGQAAFKWAPDEGIKIDYEFKCKQGNLANHQVMEYLQLPDDVRAEDIQKVKLALEGYSNDGPSEELATNNVVNNKRVMYGDLQINLNEYAALEPKAKRQKTKEEHSGNNQDQQMHLIDIVIGNNQANQIQRSYNVVDNDQDQQMISSGNISNHSDEDN